MIPLRLHLKNFLSYGSPLQTINFEPYTIIYLSGKNGHGKSALLDALTWCLWGHARKISGSQRSDDALLRLGQSHMVVGLDFMCQGKIYRVRREYSQERSKGNAQLDFGMHDAETGKMRQLTGKTIRDTQELINRTVGIDGIGFENSAFLKQGQSDEFSRKSPKDRKETLAHILGLSTYELLRKKVIEAGRAETTFYQQTQQICALLRQDAALYQEHCTEQTRLLTHNAQHNATEKELLSAEETVRHEITQLLLITQTLEQEKRQLTAARNKEIDLVHSLQKLWKERRLAQTTLIALYKHHRPTMRSKQLIIHDLAQLQSTLAQRITLVEQLSQSRIALHELEMYLTESLRQAEELARTEVARFESTYTLMTHQHETLLTRHQESTLRYQALQTTVTTIPSERLAELHSTKEAVHRDQEDARARLARISSLITRVTHDKNNSAKQYTDLQLEDSSTCPTCHQTITQSHRAGRLYACTQDISRFTHQLNRLQPLLTHTKQVLKKGEAALEDVQREYAQTQHTLAAVQAKEIELAQEHKQLILLQEAVATSRTRLQEAELIKNSSQRNYELMRSEHQNIHDTDPSLNTLKKRIAEQERTLAATENIATQYSTLQEELCLAEKQEEIDQNMHATKDHQKELSHAVGQLCVRLREQRILINQSSPVQTRSLQIEAQLIAKKEEEQRIHKEISGIRTLKSELARQLGALEQAIAHSNKQQTLLKAEEEKIKLCEQTIADYSALAQALSKDGIQGMLIEQALPEIEQEANHLLARLTENQAQIRFDSQRELKSGGLKETLDIKISDSLGIRPYELFSGGEAFRIDFALRLAIAKLLARRSGSSLQTLIIDEGFGSQDEEGLNDIMEALFSIQNEFAKIIIVSHLPTMKEQFPIHFHVHKTPQGSLISVIEQG